MNLILSPHTRQIGGMELGFRYSQPAAGGFEMALTLPMGVYPAAYSEKIKAGANTWAMKLAVAMPTLVPVIVEHVGREILISGETVPPLIDALLVTLPNDLQNAFAANEPAETAKPVSPAKVEANTKPVTEGLQAMTDPIRDLRGQDRPPGLFRSALGLLKDPPKSS